MWLSIEFLSFEKRKKFNWNVFIACLCYVISVILLYTIGAYEGTFI